MNEQDFAIIRKKALAQAKKRDAEVKASMPAGFRHFDIGRNWKKLAPYAETKEARRRLDRDLRIYSAVRAREADEHYKKLGHKNYSSSWNQYTEGTMPNGLDTRCQSMSARPKKYEDYILGGGCHWIVNWSLCILEHALPKKEWRIVSSDLHSAVWDGNKTFFDITYFPRGLSIDDTYWNTIHQGSCRILAPGQELKLY